MPVVTDVEPSAPGRARSAARRWQVDAVRDHADPIAGAPRAAMNCGAVLGVGDEDRRRPDRPADEALAERERKRVPLAPDAGARSDVAPEQAADDVRDVAVRQQHIGPACAEHGGGPGQPGDGARRTAAPPPPPRTPRDAGLAKERRRAALRVVERPHLDDGALDGLQVAGEHERLPLRASETRPLEHERDPHALETGAGRRSGGCDGRRRGAHTSVRTGCDRAGSRRFRVAHTPPPPRVPA